MFLFWCAWERSVCKTKINNEEVCKDCVKDLTSKQCKFVEQSKAFKQLVAYAMIGQAFKDL